MTFHYFCKAGGKYLYIFVFHVYLTKMIKEMMVLKVLSCMCQQTEPASVFRASYVPAGGNQHSNAMLNRHGLFASLADPSKTHEGELET